MSPWQQRLWGLWGDGEVGVHLHGNGAQGLLWGFGAYGAYKAYGVYGGCGEEGVSP